jgi:hypothetical protein
MSPGLYADSTTWPNSVFAWARGQRCGRIVVQQTVGSRNETCVFSSPGVGQWHNLSPSRSGCCAEGFSNPGKAFVQTHSWGHLNPQTVTPPLPNKTHLLVGLPLCVQRLVLRHALPAVQLQRHVVEQLPQHTGGLEGRTAAGGMVGPGGVSTQHTARHTRVRFTWRASGNLSCCQNSRH